MTHPDTLKAMADAIGATPRKIVESPVRDIAPDGSDHPRYFSIFDRDAQAQAALDAYEKLNPPLFLGGKPVKGGGIYQITFMGNKTTKGAS